MGRIVFHDCDEFADSMVGVVGRFVPTARAVSDWWIEAARLNSTTLTYSQLGGAATFAGDGEPEALTLAVPMTDPAALMIDGRTLDQRSLVTIRTARPYTFTSRGVCRWVGIKLPPDHPSISAHTHEALDSPNCGRDIRIRTEPRQATRIRALVSRLCAADESLRRMDEAASVAAEEEIISAAASALEQGLEIEDRHVGRPQFSRRRVIARALALIQANAGQPLFVQDLCRAAQVSERTLRNVFHEYFGVGPMRMVRVRQLHEIRAELLSADRAHDTVTRIASRFGVWDFSLFARNYRRLYDESPSETLNQPPQRRAAVPDGSWIRYASRIFVDDAVSMMQQELEPSACYPTAVDAHQQH
jgi:AraC family transcriptional regulator, ethanolamine operon transcriptional activator